MEMPLSVVDIAYHIVLDYYTDPDPIYSQTDEEDPILKHVSATSSSFSHDLINDTLRLYEEIVEVMNGSDRPCDDIHHCSYFLTELARIKQDNFISILSKIVGHVVVPLYMHDIYVEGNMASIYPTITIDISRIPSKIENVYISADCSFCRNSDLHLTLQGIM
jgi:hypothetical protein